MSTPFYCSCQKIGRFIRRQCIREFVLGAEHVPATGPVLLAVTHISHLEPVIISSLIERQIHWMARTEFYKYRLGAAVLHRVGAFPVDRSGPALPSLRKAIELVRAGRAVGVFPEGGVARGADSVLHGGAIRQGVCLIALRTSTPVIPVVVLGARALNHIGPWLPRRRARLWLAFGLPLSPPFQRLSNRQDRAAMSAQLQERFIACYNDLLLAAGLSPGVHE
jgi:1-acyl-sn-glycerol-3-phosphate acyltransferase